MRNGLFARLAAVNIKKNKSTYIPYMLTCMVSIAMFYMMLFINQNKGMNSIPHSADVKMIITMGIVVIGIFSFIFLMYRYFFVHLFLLASQNSRLSFTFSKRPVR